MTEPIINKVADSGLITLNLEQFLPQGEVAIFDLKEHLFMGLILKEKDFRAALQATDWSQYQDKHVAVFCSADAVIPVWAYMLLVTYLEPLTRSIRMGTEAELRTGLLLENIRNIDASSYVDQRVVIKGCGEIHIPDEAYMEITTKLRPYAKSIMYGEPCSTVPIYKKKNI